MASSKEYLDFVLEQLSDLNNIRYRPMMGEFIIYYKDKVIGGIYDDRFLVKQTNSSKKLMPDAPLELPYEGANEMFLVEEIENKGFLSELFNSMVDELPTSKKK